MPDVDCGVSDLLHAVLYYIGLSLFLMGSLPYTQKYDIGIVIIVSKLIRAYRNLFNVNGGSVV